MDQKGIKMGRDRFFNYLRGSDQLIRPRRKYVVTTRSHHRFRVYKNLLEGRKLHGANQVWVSDITYLRTCQGFCYLSLITDAFSRKIVGFKVSDTLELQGCLDALKMAIGQLPEDHELIHHSDRGIQYCSNQYTSELKQNRIRISMAEKGNCYQNAVAERVNGILKSEFYLDRKFNNLGEASRTAKKAIGLYNTLRPHMSLKLKTPENVHLTNKNYIC